LEEMADFFMDRSLICRFGTIHYGWRLEPWQNQATKEGQNDKIFVIYLFLEFLINVFLQALSHCWICGEFRLCCFII
jgi:hypothetical protein